MDNLTPMTLMKEIEIIPIAKKKLKRRGIPEKWIIETLNSPDQMVPGFGGRRVAHRKYMIKGKLYLLRVVFEEDSGKYVVVTSYLTSQIIRYWKEDENEDRI